MPFRTLIIAAGLTLAAPAAAQQAAQAPIVGYVRNQSGFMANLSIDGTKFNKLDL